MSDNYAAIGWVKCPESSIFYHPRHDEGCGRCIPCIDREQVKRKERANVLAIMRNNNSIRPVTDLD